MRWVVRLAILYARLMHVLLVTPAAPYIASANNIIMHCTTHLFEVRSVRCTGCRLRQATQQSSPNAKSCSASHSSRVGEAPNRPCVSAATDQRVSAAAQHAGVVHAAMGQSQAPSSEHLRIAQQCFQAVGSSAAECDTIPGRITTRKIYAVRHPKGGLCLKRQPRIRMTVNPLLQLVVMITLSKLDNEICFELIHRPELSTMNL